MESPPNVLIACHSAFNSIVLTEDASGLRTLRFGADGLRQSVIQRGEPAHLELSYAATLPLGLALATNPARLLLIGLGGGTLARYFHHAFPELSIEAVELDPMVVEIARAYCELPDDSRLRVTVSDARDFIESSAGGYDVIVLDSYDAEEIPAHLLTLEYLQAVRCALTPSGVAVANIWGRRTNRQFDDMLMTWRAAFADVYVLEVPGPGTHVFLGLPREEEITRAELIRRVRGWSLRAELREQLLRGLHGFHHARDQRVKGGKVMRDSGA